METEKIITEQKPKQREYNFKPGISGNPGGRPKGSNKALLDIQNAITQYEAEHGVSYWTAATLIAMSLAEKGNVSLLGKILDKFVPSQVEGIGFSDGETKINIIYPANWQPKDRLHGLGA